MAAALAVLGGLSVLAGLFLLVLLLAGVGFAVAVVLLGGGGAALAAGLLVDFDKLRGPPK